MSLFFFQGKILCVGRNHIFQVGIWRNFAQKNTDLWVPPKCPFSFSFFSFFFLFFGGVLLKKSFKVCRRISSVLFVGKSCWCVIFWFILEMKWVVFFHKQLTRSSRSSDWLRGRTSEPKICNLLVISYLPTKLQDPILMDDIWKPSCSWMTNRKFQNQAPP